MKKFTKTLVLAMIMVFSLSTVAFAAPSTTAKDLQAKLQQLGVPSSYVGNVVEYLQNVNVTDAQVATLTGSINKAQALMESETNLEKIPEATRQALYSTAVEAGNAVGLKVTVAKGTNGVRTSIAVADAAGKSIMALTTADIQNLVKNDTITSVVEAAADFSNNPDKSKFDPITGEPNKTAAGYGNTMVLGFALVALAGTVALVSRKRAIA